MGYLSCRADSSVATCRSITAISPLPISRRSAPAATPEIERFAYDDLEAATSHFADAALLGRGSHGAVYKAVLPSGRLVAVKRPSPRRAEVDNEIRILSSLRGPRLVNLLGYSDPGPDCRPRLLVVEYMPNGTLYDLLHPSSASPSTSSSRRPPGWPRRIRLALQTARALRALHDAEPAVIHRDVKSANVLLDANLDAHLGDFGLALRVPKGGTGNATTPAPAGTLGYLDPAYVTPESLSTKTDVFSFGILLLEIMSGRKAIDVQYSPPSVVEWAVPLLRKGKVVALFDPRVAPPRDPVTRRDLAVLAASCVRSNRERRPSMSDIVERLTVLSKAVSAKVWNGMAVVGNPCAIVDVQKTVSKRAAASEKESTSGVAFDDDDDDKEADAALEELVPLVGARKPPRPLKNGKVFSETGNGERRNLMELMARIDGVAGQRFAINRARTVRGTSDLLIDKDAVLILRRNQTVKVVESEALGKAEKFSRLDTNIKLKVVKEQEKSGKIQDKADEVQGKAEKIQEKDGKIQEKIDEVDQAENIQEKMGKIIDKTEKSQATPEKIQENERKIQEHTMVVQHNAGKIQDKAEKMQEKEGKIQEKIGKVDKAENIQENTGQIIDKAEKSQATPEKIQENERKFQEDTKVVQHNAGQIQDKAEKIQCKMGENSNYTTHLEASLIS